MFSAKVLFFSKATHANDTIFNSKKMSCKKNGTAATLFGNKYYLRKQEINSKMKRLIIATVAFMLCIAIAAQEKIKVACIGNSVTYGYGHSTPAETSYPAQLGKMLGEGYEVGNFGKSGATLLNKGHRPYTQQPEYKAALDFAPDIAIIHLGLNDTDPRNWPNYRDQFIPDYLALIDTLRSINPAVDIKICRMTPIFHWHKRFKSGTRDWHAQIQETIEETAQLAGVELIDLQELLYHRPDLMPDALHPNTEGAAIIAKRAYSAITGDFGGLALPAIYGSNMVIQQGKPFTICGTANAGDMVTASLDKEQASAIAGKNGKWAITFKPMKADGKSHTLTIKCGKEKITYKNIAVGEVWLCSGQSNMAFMVKESAHKEESLDKCKNRNVRLYDMKPRVYTDNIEWSEEDLSHINSHDYYLPATWQKADKESVSTFSAVAYHFGAMLADSLGVPVGLICNAIGGAPAEAFIDRCTLEWDPVLCDILYNWRSNDMIQEWCRSRASQNIKKSSNPMQRHPYEPAYLYETGIAPLGTFPVKGFIWYQGESNAHNTELHEKIFPTLVDSWRRTWDSNDMPFYFVQLSSIERPSWPLFRDSQRRLAASIENCDFAVSSDKGNQWDVHPKEKKPIGERLARHALNGTYGQRHVTPCGPKPIKAVRMGNSIIVTFEHASGLASSDGKELRTFEIAGEIGTYLPAESVEVIGNKIRIKNCDIEVPCRVRYGWQPYTTANLVNSDGLPAGTFEIAVEGLR